MQSCWLGEMSTKFQFGSQPYESCLLTSLQVTATYAGDCNQMHCRCVYFNMFGVVCVCVCTVFPARVYGSIKWYVRRRTYAKGKHKHSYQAAMYQAALTTTTACLSICLGTHTHTSIPQCLSTPPTRHGTAPADVCDFMRDVLASCGEYKGG